MEKNKKSGKKLLITLIILLLLICLVIFLLTSPKFILQNIDVSGNKEIQTERIIEYSRMKKGKNIFVQRYFKGKFELEEQQIIEKVSYKFKFPNTIEINITERKAEYQISAPKGYYVIDNQGYVLKKYDEKQEYIMINNLKTNLEQEKRLILDDLLILEKINKITQTVEKYNFKKMITDIELDNDNFIINLRQEKKKIILDSDLVDIRGKMVMIKEIIERNKGKEGEIYLNKNIKREYFVFKEKV